MYDVIYSYQSGRSHSKTGYKFMQRRKEGNMSKKQESESVYAEMWKMKREICETIQGSFDYSAISLIHRIMQEPALGFDMDKKEK